MGDQGAQLIPESVSVIIPTFDRVHALERAVRSCLAQTHPVMEVLVCDDGSTDGSKEMIAQLGDARVQWLQGTPAGRPAVPRNRGIAAARGNWLAFLDDDDAWDVDKLRLQFDRLRGSGLRAACSNAYRIKPEDLNAGPYFTGPSRVLTLDDLLTVNQVICSSMLVDRTLVLHVGGFPTAGELTAVEDYALWLRISTRTPILYCAEPLVRYSDSPAQSLRAHWTDADKQRDAVLTELLAWDGAAVLEKSQLRSIRKRLRASRRASGRPMRDWLFMR